jgi:hypothetical protein
MMKRIKLAAGILLGRASIAAGRSLTVYADDRFVVSYPRSGNTWVRFLVGNLIHDDPVTFTNVEQRVPDIYQNSDDELQKMIRPRLLKSHEYFDPRYGMVLYMVRDPRDVAVSYYHYHLKTRRIEDGYPLERYVSRFVSGELDPFGSWQENVGSWLGARQGSSGFLLIRYEEILERPQRELFRIASFLGIPTEAEDAERAVQASSWANMREMESQQSHLWQTTKKSRKDKPFVRAGESGAWQGVLSRVSAEEIESAWGTQMKSLGYLT